MLIQSKKNSYYFKIHAFDYKHGRIFFRILFTLPFIVSLPNTKWIFPVSAQQYIAHSLFTTWVIPQLLSCLELCNFLFFLFLYLLLYFHFYILSNNLTFSRVKIFTFRPTYLLQYILCQFVIFLFIIVFLFVSNGSSFLYI